MGNGSKNQQTSSVKPQAKKAGTAEAEQTGSPLNAEPTPELYVRPTEEELLRRCRRILDQDIF